MISSSWHFDERFSRDFHCLEKALAVPGERITSSPISYVLKAVREDCVFYIKVYTRAGKYLRRFLGRSRVKGEWENLLFFQSLDIPTANIVACGETRHWGFFQRGILVTQEIPGSIDLGQLTRQSHHIKDKALRLDLLFRVALITKKLHDARFIHNDLKWRNILINDEPYPEIFLIDCPLGAKKAGPLLKRGRIKDLACLDKVGRNLLSRADRLRFYKWYLAKDRLDDADRARIRQITSYFSGRD